MTREDAIQIIADLIKNPFLHTWEEQCKALNMAIEALQEPEIVNGKRIYHCGGCRYINLDYNEFPCNECMYSCTTDRWKSEYKDGEETTTMSVPPSERESGWIPIVFPKDRERVLFSQRLPGGKYEVFIGDGQYVREHWKDKHIIAWQPLPESYKAESEVEK